MHAVDEFSSLLSRNCTLFKMSSSRGRKRKKNDSRLNPFQSRDFHLESVTRTLSATLPMQVDSEEFYSFATCFIARTRQAEGKRKKRNEYHEEHGRDSRTMRYDSCSRYCDN